MRLVFLGIMVTSYFSLGICDLAEGKLKTGVASMLLGIVQLLIFCEGK